MAALGHFPTFRPPRQLSCMGDLSPFAPTQAAGCHLERALISGIRRSQVRSSIDPACGRNDHMAQSGLDRTLTQKKREPLI